MLWETGGITVNNRIQCGGHRACKMWTEIQDGRAATRLQECLELRADSGIHWSFPETLWSILMDAWPRPVQAPSLVVGRVTATPRTAWQSLGLSA